MRFSHQIIISSSSFSCPTICKKFVKLLFTYKMQKNSWNTNTHLNLHFFPIFRAFCILYLYYSKCIIFPFFLLICSLGPLEEIESILSGVEYDVVNKTMVKKVMNWLIMLFTCHFYSILTKTCICFFPS